MSSRSQDRAAVLNGSIISFAALVDRFDQEVRRKRDAEEV